MANKKLGILWDWNGTIVDDAWLFVDILNLLLKKNNKPLVTIKKYKDNFCFPIDQYYKKIDLYKDKDFYKNVCLEFIDLYEKKMFSPVCNSVRYTPLNRITGCLRLSPRSRG